MDATDALLATCQEALQAAHLQLISSALEDVSTPIDDSPYNRERRELAASVARARSQIWKQTLGVSELILSNLTDHMRALYLLLGSGYPLYAHANLARVAFEAELRLRYLLSHRIDLETRLLRGAATLLHSAREDVKAVSEMLPGVRDLPKGERYLQQKLKDFQGVLHDAGMIETGGSISWPDGRTERIVLNVTDRAKEVGGLPGFYRLSSGLAHSGPWMLDDLKQETRKGGKPMPDPVNVGGTVDVVLVVCTRATEVHARYYGHDFVTYNDRIKRHRKALTEAITEVGRTAGRRRG